MRYFLMLLPLQIAKQNPTVTLDRQKVDYEKIIRITISNNTSRVIFYRIDLDVLVGDFWGAADTDILNPAKDKVVSYKIKSLAPGRQSHIYYNTKYLSKNYVDTYSGYRVSVYYTSANNKKKEHAVYSKTFEIKE